MPIRVGHEPPFAGTARMALAVGRGAAAQRARQVEEERARFEAEQERQEREAEARARQGAEALDWDKRKFYEQEGFKQQREDVQWRRDLERMGIDAELQQKIEVWREQVRAAGEDARYNTKQLRDIEAINERLQWVNEQEDWPPEDKQHAQGELVAQLLKITPFPAPQREWPKGQGPGQYWTEDDSQTGGRRVLTRDHDGDVRVISEPKDQTKPVFDLYSQLTKDMTTTDPDTNVPIPPDHKAVMERLREIMGEVRQMRGGPAAGVPAPEQGVEELRPETRKRWLEQAREQGRKAAQPYVLRAGEAAQRPSEKGVEQRFRNFIEDIEVYGEGKGRTGGPMLQELWRAFETARNEALWPHKGLAERSAEALAEPPPAGKVGAQWFLTATMVEDRNNPNLLKLHRLIFEQHKHLNDPEVQGAWNGLSQLEKTAVARALQVTGVIAEMAAETKRPSLR